MTTGQEKNFVLCSLNKDAATVFAQLFHTTSWVSVEELTNMGIW